MRDGRRSVPVEELSRIFEGGGERTRRISGQDGSVIHGVGKKDSIWGKIEFTIG